MTAAAAPKNRACVLSTRTAQALANARFTGRGWTTVRSRLWTWRWPFGCTSTRLASTSVPPLTRHARGGRCPPMALVIAWSHLGQRPVCSHQRCTSFRRPGRSACLGRPLRALQSGSQGGSYGLAWLRMLLCRRLRVSRLSASRTGCGFPAGWVRVTPNAQLPVARAETSCFFSPLLRFVGGCRLAQRHTWRSIAWAPVAHVFWRTQGR